MIVQRKHMLLTRTSRSAPPSKLQKKKEKKKNQLHAHSTRQALQEKNFTKDFQQEPKRRRTYVLLTRKSKPSQPSQLLKPVTQFIEDKKETSKSQKKDLDVPNLYICVCVCVCTIIYYFSSCRREEELVKMCVFSALLLLCFS